MATYIPNDDSSTINASPQWVMYRKNFSVGPQKKDMDQNSTNSAQTRMGTLQYSGETLPKHDRVNGSVVSFSSFPRTPVMQ